MVLVVQLVERLTAAQEVAGSRNYGSMRVMSTKKSKTAQRREGIVDASPQRTPRALAGHYT